MAIKKIGVIGAGMMGSEIALCFAQNGFDVKMSDASLELAQKGKEKQAGVLDKNIKRGRMEADQKEPVLARITPVGALADMADRDMIIEAAAEIYEVKCEIFKELDKVTGKDCILASNTSSISITKLGASVSRERATRFIGTHFFSPATVMKLVEVIPSQLCAEEIVDTVKALMTEIGKTAIRVKDVTGFAVNRLLHAYFAEAQRLLEEGVATVEDIDTACMLGLGYPVGPFKLMDTTNLALNVQVEGVLFDAYGDRFRASQTLQNMASAGLLGRASGEGFYKYD